MTVAVQDATVLIVEDNVSNFVLMARMLGFVGVTCEWKTSGFEVVEYADTLPKVDLILMDIRLPYEDGYQALRKLRASSGCEPSVVAVTAATKTSSTERAAGFGGFIGKLDQTASRPDPASSKAGRVAFSSDRGLVNTGRQPRVARQPVASFCFRWFVPLALMGGRPTCARKSWCVSGYTACLRPLWRTPESSRPGSWRAKSASTSPSSRRRCVRRSTPRLPAAHRNRSFPAWRLSPRESRRCSARSCSPEQTRRS
jgi:two-component system cell cycle response regulator DivK